MKDYINVKCKYEVNNSLVGNMHHFRMYFTHDDNFYNITFKGRPTPLIQDKLYEIYSHRFPNLKKEEVIGIADGIISDFFNACILSQSDGKVPFKGYTEKYDKTRRHNAKDVGNDGEDGRKESNIREEKSKDGREIGRIIGSEKGKDPGETSFIRRIIGG